ncbi:MULTISPECIES: hypothetical protein [unclassified Acinetobacter]|uniref:defense against restriction DarA-related protein n=1 Tax=unclassified Acinetobacter TaxID=196816 RepID=UPI002448C037|nr:MULTISPECIES: hypothetical protein [unclassified Acinetobacter]MDH0032915.1 hypothetical protein [Acinetobacter sp. GD04021]MDH0887310.1 hypothetical protein [Acinetobacter sp. GD03873]MDH1084706.1 hypothetical protein [Acinetobacter sp. GD03983]MDH2190626.1 hypothetical protein [Acinetobacter sp. GD03645]MDH2205080.1 hypothetical protein [Acinetobacter sp. GD03647]
MRNIDIFHPLHEPHTSRIVEGFDSVNSGSCSIGVIKGQYRQLNAIVTETATDDDQWRIVNLKGQIKQVPAFDSIAVLGAVDDDQASALAQLQFGRMFDAIEDDVIETNLNGLLRHLATPHFHKNKQLIHRCHLTALQDVPCAVVPGWDGIELTTHEGKTANLLLDMQRHDDQSGLLSSFDGLAQLLESIGAEYADFDSIIVEYQYLDRLVNMLHKAMQTASKGGVKVLKVDQSDKPFRHKKVLNVAVSYDFEDGQTITILFHHPDRDAKRIAPQDTLLSWKILMNNRDVTGVIQPNQGEGIALPVLAGRVVKLINQNSARFKRTQVKKAASAQALADAEQRIADKRNQKSALEAQIQGLLEQSEESAKSQTQTEIEQSQKVNDEMNAFGADKAGYQGVVTSIEDAEKVKDMPDGSWVIKQSDQGYTFFYQLPDGKYSASETLPTLEQAYQSMLESREANLKYPDDSDALARYQAEKQANNEPAQHDKPKLVTKTEAKNIYDALSIRHSWLTGGTTEEFFRQNYPESINEALTEAKALLDRPFGKVATASGLKQSIERMVQSVENTIERWKAGKTEDAPKTKTYPPIEDLGNGFYRAFKNDKKVDTWTAHINPNGEWEVSANNAQSRASWNRGLGAPRFFKTIEEMMVKYPAFRSLPALLEAKVPDGNEPDDTGNEASTDDVDYLNKVIKGEVDFSNSSEIETQLEAIGGRLTSEINDLFEQAVTAYSVYQVDQAKLIN